jgi:hypothetical protein
VQASPSLQAVPSGRTGAEQTPVDVSQTPTSWHWSTGAQITGAPVQTPALQASASVQGSPSLQVVPSGKLGLEQRPVTWSQTPTSWHGSSGGQVTGLAPVHTPPTQVSVCVHPSPSSHSVPFVAATCVQPLAGLQPSVVQGLPSSHEMAALAQDPSAQVPPGRWHLSVVVQATPSLSAQLPVALQAWHAPHALLVQQNPSVQMPFLHWLGAVQAAPRSSLLVHAPTGRSWQ